MSPAVDLSMRNTDTPRHLTAALAVVAVTLVSLLVPSTTASAAETDTRQATTANVTSGPWLDTSNRQSVIDSHDAEFSQATPAIEWTGDLATCDAGSVNPAFRAATIDRVNWFRSLAGVPATITENIQASALAQEAAAMNSASDRISHTATDDFECHTDNAAAGARTGNLYLGRTGPHAINGYILDPGEGNTSVGHRNWILSPTARQFGTGDVPANPNAAQSAAGSRSTNVLIVNEGSSIFDPSPTLREPSGFVAWPARGYTPSDVVFPRWSFSLRDADFTNASVTTEHMINGTATAVASPVVFNNRSGGAPFDIIVWEPALAFPTENNPHGTLPLPKPAEDQTYRVTVSNVRVGNSTQSFTYDVTVIGDEAAPLPVSARSANSDFTNAAFNDFLGRDATSAELAEWSRQLAAGTSRGELVTGLTQSDEWITGVVDTMYNDTLGRSGDAGGRAYWIDRVRDGLTVAEMAAMFYGSPEYLANENNSVEQWVNDLYDELLLRPSDNGGREYWMNQADANGILDVASRFYQSPESRRARVQALYQDLLGRGTDQSGEDFWSEQLNDGNDLALAANLASSDEYFANASR